jgi:23S rRNA (uracil1939-C5)-methyltransferase
LEETSLETVTLKLTAAGPFGGATGTCQGRLINVFGGIPGETVSARILREAGDLTDAIVKEVIEPSPHRRQAPCPYFGECTGCQYQQIDYPHQLELKRESVIDALTGHGITAPVNPAVPSPDEFGYRNHARLTVRRRANRFGFINRVTRRFVPIDHCLIMAEGVNSLLSALDGRCGETSQFSIRYGVNTDEFLIQPKLKNPDITVTSGQLWYHEILCGRRFRVSSPAFFQVNTPQAENLADLIGERLALTGAETIIDAYAGVATFAALLAPRVKKVIAIEESSAAVKDARVNIKGLANVELLEARTESVLPHLGKLADAVIIDPSRNGCHPGALRILNRHPASRLVYVSCNPEALGRDLATLTRGPWIIEDITPVDLFPQTYHVETVVTLKYDPERELAFNRRQELVLASASPRRADLLTAIGLQFTIAVSGVDETPVIGLSPDEQALYHARSKASAVAKTMCSGTVIAADTVVDLDGEILGKPTSPASAATMLQRLHGRSHRVVTAVAVVDAATGETLADMRVSRVTMRHYTDDEINDYVNSGSPMDKAGAYGIQDKRFNPVERVKGCYHNVVGLPVCLLLDTLLKLGVHPKADLKRIPGDKCPDCRRWQSY